MQLFIQILKKIAEIQNVVKDNKNLLQIIAGLSAFTQKELGFMCESWVNKIFVFALSLMNVDSRVLCFLVVLCIVLNVFVVFLNSSLS